MSTLRLISTLLSAIFLSACMQTNFSKSAAPGESVPSPLPEKSDQSSGLVRNLGDCLLPWGSTLADGGTVDAYKSDSLPCQERCENQKTQLSCAGGTLSGDITYTKGTCRELGCPSCSLSVPGSSPGQVSTQNIAHAEELDFYSAGKVACGQTCDAIKQHRRCDRGIFTGEGEEFKFVSCQVEKCTCEAPDPANPSLTIRHPHGMQLEFWDASTIQCDKCDAHKVVRTCENGKWSGDLKYIHRKCLSSPCTDCKLPWDASRTVKSRQVDPEASPSSQIMFLDPAPACAPQGLGCKSASRTCFNAVFETGPSGDGSNRDKADFNSAACDCRCQIPGTTEFINKGASRNFWTKKQLQCGETANSYLVTVSCNGAGQFAFTGAASNFSTFSAWSNSQPPSLPCTCTTPWNTTINIGATGTAFRIGQALCTNACSATGNSQGFICGKDEDGNMALLVNPQPGAGPQHLDTGTFTKGSCAPAICSCLAPDPTNPAVNISHPNGTQLEFWDAASVQCASCNDHKIMRTCDRGTWSGSAAYSRRSCASTPCANCALPWNSAIIIKSDQIVPPAPSATPFPGDSPVPMFLAPSPACPTACQSVTRKCHNGVFETGPSGIGSNDKSAFNSEACACRCPIPGTAVTLNKGQSKSYWTVSTLTCGQVADNFKVDFACPTNGTALTTTPPGTNITGITSWSTSQPPTLPCTCSTPWGAINEGVTGTAYKKTAGACNNKCTAPGTFIGYRCGRDTAGALKLLVNPPPATGSPLVDTATYIAGACSQPVCNCSAPWGEILPDLWTGIASRTQVVDCGGNCDLETVPVKCDASIGILVGTDPGKPFNPLIHLFPSCLRNGCPGTDPGAGNGSGGTGGGAGGGQGSGLGRGRNDEDIDPQRGGGGPGPVCINAGCDAVTRTEYDSLPKDFETTFFLNRSLDLTNPRDLQVSQSSRWGRYCILPWANPAPANVSPDFGMGGAIAIGNYVAGFRKSQVECTERCEDFRVRVACGPRGRIIAPPGALFPSCKKRAGCP